MDDLKEHKFDIVYLLGQDNLDFEKKEEFVIYQGSHGDKGAEYADIILPGAAYTEQDGYFTNLEGKIQKAYKANYPTEQAKEDWIIINELSELLKRKKLFDDKDNLVGSMMNYLKINKKKNYFEQVLNENFTNEKIVIDSLDYYYSNVISRASKTMNECRNEKIKTKSNGTTG